MFARPGSSRALPAHVHRDYVASLSLLSTLLTLPINGDEKSGAAGARRTSCRSPRCPAEVTVDRGTGHAELGRDLRNGVRALAVLIGLVVHLARELDLPRTELWLTTRFPTAHPRHTGQRA